VKDSPIVHPAAGPIQRASRNRIAAAGTGALALLLIVWSGSIWAVLLLGPLLVGAVVAAVQSAAADSWIQDRASSFHRLRTWSEVRSGKFARFVVKPTASGSIWLWDRTAPVSDPHLRSGVRVASALYFWSLMLAVLAIAAYVVLIIALIVLAFVVLGWLLSQSGGGSTETSSYSRPQRSGSSSWFATKCANCGSTEHASDNCPHGMFSSACSGCGSKEHASGDCPHGIFASSCSSCGSNDHATAACPHGMFSTSCSHCGNKNHASSDCPHGLFSSACAHCDSRGHATADCPH
jgi:hypothetical protein